MIKAWVQLSDPCCIHSSYSQNVGRVCTEPGDFHTLVFDSGKVHSDICFQHQHPVKVSCVIFTPGVLGAHWKEAGVKCGLGLRKLKKSLIYDTQNANGFSFFVSLTVLLQGHIFKALNFIIYF